MFISVLEIFKIGIGPSSSHTMGPMVAANRFLEELRSKPGRDAARLAVHLYGSLAFTGKGHGTDRAVVLGLAGFTPENLENTVAQQMLDEIARTKRINPPGLQSYGFDPDRDIVFDYGPALPGHANGMRFCAYGEGRELHQTVYYSIGGGFVLDADELASNATLCTAPEIPKPYPFRNGREMLQLGRDAGKSILEMKRANELCFYSESELTRRLDRIWSVMNDCINRGLEAEGTLPGGLGVKRRAKGIYQKLIDEQRGNVRFAHEVNDWIAVYAMAVNEENAAGGQVVTAPTNGAAGVIPAVIRYYLEFCPGARQEDVRDFLLVAAAIGGLIKHNASISGAEVGCQGEVGSASAMAAAGLCAVLGGTNEQIENAAEIALEHHLGMTCDPVAGLVQVPCIERNGFGAVKAITAASLALRGDGSHVVELDKCVETMRQTGADMSLKYKETSTGGLAVNVVAC